MKLLGIELSPRKKVLLEEIKELKNELAKLKDELAGIKKLSRLISVCSGCKKIRNGNGDWKEIVSYITNHSEAKFSHGICPECTIKFYPELCDENGKIK